MFLAVWTSFTLIPLPASAFQAYICENDKYQLIACVSSFTASQTQYYKMHFEELDFVKIIEKTSKKTFRFSPIMYHISGGGGSRFQSFTQKGYSFFLEDTRVLNVSMSDDTSSLSGYFLEFPGERVSDNRIHNVKMECPHNIFGQYTYLDSTDGNTRVFACQEFENNVFSKKYSTYYGDEKEYFGEIRNPLQ